jgi:hypothetical protein
MPQRKILPKATGDDDTEGHRRNLNKATGDDDTEGHRRNLNKATGDDTDTEGHRRRPVGATGDDDTEGQSMLSNPLLNRQLASAREQEIQRNLKQRQKVDEARRPYNKRER